MKTITIQHQSIPVSDEAYTPLVNYLQSIREHFAPDAEAVADIEFAALDLIHERMKESNNTEVTNEEVSFLISNLGTVETISSELETVELRAGKKLYRDTEKGWVGGVAAGLAAYFDLPVWVLRVGFIAAFVFPLPSIVPYVILWFVMPPTKSKADQLRMHGVPVNITSLSSSEDYTRKRVITLAKIVAICIGVAVISVGALFTYILVQSVLG